jgi:hypothetical protein
MLVIVLFKDSLSRIIVYDFTIQKYIELLASCVFLNSAAVDMFYDFLSLYLWSTVFMTD